MTNFQLPLLKEIADEHRSAIRKEFARRQLACACSPGRNLGSLLGGVLVRFGTWLEGRAYRLQQRQMISQLYVRSTGELRS